MNTRQQRRSMYGRRIPRLSYNNLSYNRPQLSHLAMPYLSNQGVRDLVGNSPTLVGKCEQNDDGKFTIDLEFDGSHEKWDYILACEEYSSIVIGDLNKQSAVFDQIYSPKQWKDIQNITSSMMIPVQKPNDLPPIGSIGIATKFTNYPATVVLGYNIPKYAYYFDIPFLPLLILGHIDHTSKNTSKLYIIHNKESNVSLLDWKFCHGPLKNVSETMKQGVAIGWQRISNLKDLEIEKLKQENLRLKSNVESLKSNEIQLKQEQCDIVTDIVDSLFARALKYTRGRLVWDNVGKQFTENVILSSKCWNNLDETAKDADIDDAFNWNKLKSICRFEWVLDQLEQLWDVGNFAKIVQFDDKRRIQTMTLEKIKFAYYERKDLLTLNFQVIRIDEHGRVFGRNVEDN